MGGAVAAQADDFFALFGIPDHDQRRSGLPGDGGMYCVPTATYNLFDFMRMHGVPAMGKNLADPGNAILTSNPYLGHTMRIASLGAYMDTDAADGTNGSGWTNGLIDYINANCHVPLICFSYDRDDNFPSPGAMMDWMRMGGLVSMCYGRYDNPYGTDKARHGGHCITLNEVWETEHDFPNPLNFPWFPEHYYTYQVGYRDPAADEGNVAGRLTNQSPFATTVRNTYAEHATFNGDETTLFGLGEKPASNSSNYAYIDGYRVLLPLCMLTNVVNSDNFHLNLSLAFNAEKASYSTRSLGNLDLPYKLDTRGAFALDPVLPGFITTDLRTNKILQAGYLTGAARPIATAPSHPIALEFGGAKLDLFVLQATQVSKLDRGNRWTAKAKLPFTPEAQVYDPITDQLIVGGGTSLLTFSPELVPLRRNEIPDMRGDGSVRLSLHFDQKNDTLYGMRKGSNRLFIFKRSRSGWAMGKIVPLDGLRMPTSFDLGPDGHLFVADGGRLHEFLSNGRPAKGSPFNNAEVGETFKFSRSWTNWSKEAYPLPAWSNLEDPGEPLG